MDEQAANDEFDDELLSAYLDGEATSDERSLVEERLRTDSRAKQLLDEMRTMSSAIKALPAVKLPRDLRAGVWEETERSPIAGRVTPAYSQREERWAGFRRGLVWSAITIAAALMLMFLQPPQPQEGEVADAQRKEKTELQREAESKNHALRGVDDVPKMSALPENSEALDDHLETESTPPPPGGAVAKGRPGAATVASAPADRSTEESIDADIVPAPEAEAPPVPGLAAPEPPANGAIVQGRERASAPPSAPLDAMDSVEDQVRLRSADAPAAKFGMPEAHFEELARDDKSTFKWQEARGAPTQVVEFTTVAPEASARFDALLVKHGIELQAEPQAMAANGGEEPLAALDGEALPKEAVLPKGHEELVLVVASPKQVADLIADLQADAQLFAAASGVARGDSELAEGGQATAGTERGAQAQGGFGGGFRETPPEEGLGAKDESPNLVKAIESLSRQGDAGAWRLKWGAEEYKRQLATLSAGVSESRAIRRYAQPSQEAAPPSEAAREGAKQSPSDRGETREAFGESGDPAEKKHASPSVRVLFVLRPQAAPAPAADAKAAQ